MDLANVAHFAPSGHILQGISYTIIDDRSILDKAVELTAIELIYKTLKYILVFQIFSFINKFQFWIVIVFFLQVV